MRQPKKLLLLQTLTDHLAGISTADGYDFDLAGRVFRGRSVFGPSDPLPAVSILEFPKPDTGVFGGFENRVFAEDCMLLVQGWITDDPTRPTDLAYVLAANVQERLSQMIAVKGNGNPAYPDVYLAGRQVGSLHIGPYTVRPPDNQVSSTAYFFLPLRVGLQTDVSAPFVSA